MRQWGGGGGPPPWWPEGQEWPPRGRPGAELRHRFQLFVGFVLGGLVLLIFTAGFFASKAFFGSSHEGFGPQNGEWDGPPFFAFIVVGIGIFLLVRFIRRFASPIADVMEAAERVSAGDLAARVQPRGPRDVRRLAGTFNEMVALMETNEEQRRRLLADVTHELRTPLSIIRGNVEGMLDGVYPRDDEHLGPIVDETKQMARLLDDLHTLATAEAGALRLHRESVDLQELIDDVVGAFGLRAADRGVRLTSSLTKGAEVELDPVRIRQVIENLLANSLRYTPAGGAISVEVAATEGEIAFAVSDSGPGVPPEQLATLFDRFAKSADSGGSGLGLAIAKSLVEAHGGTISAENLPSGGLIVRFTVPVGAE